MSTLKLYMHDSGWAGAEFYITADKQKAIEAIIDPKIAHYRKLDEMHRKDHPNEFNPWEANVIHYTTNREKILVEIDIVEGASFWTEGE